jgi:hypothetical protein
VWKYHQQLNSSSKRTDIPRPKASTRPSIEAWQHLTNFVRTRELTALRQALSKDFLVMGYPLVLGQIHHLFMLINLHTIEEVQKWDDAEVANCLMSDEAFPEYSDYNPWLIAKHSQRQAEEALQLLLSGWVPPSYTITIEEKQIARKPGPGRPKERVWIDSGEGGPPIAHSNHDIEVVNEYIELCAIVAEVYHGGIEDLAKYEIPYFWKPDPGKYETIKDLYRKMSAFIAEINQASRFGWESVSVDNEYEDATAKVIRRAPKKGTVLCRFRDLFELKEVPRKEVSLSRKKRIPKLTKKVRPIPPEEVTKIIEYAIRSKRTINPEYLLFALLGYYRGEKPGSIRAIITSEQRERKQKRKQLQTTHSDIYSLRAINLKSLLKS